MTEIYDADAYGLAIIKKVFEADSSDESARELLELIRDGIAKCGAAPLVQMVAGHAVAMAAVAQPSDPQAFLTSYEGFATLNRMGYAAEHDDGDGDIR